MAEMPTGRSVAQRVAMPSADGCKESTICGHIEAGGPILLNTRGNRMHQAGGDWNTYAAQIARTHNHQP